MRRKLVSKVVAIVSLVGVSCGVSDPDEVVLQEPEDTVETSSAEQAVANWRNDVNGILYPETGNWGNWTAHGPVFCDPGTWAIGYRMRVESSQGGGNSDDDTALNAVRLLCKQPRAGGEEWIAAHEGLWGSWHGEARCPGSNTLRSARIRLESSQGGGDDTAANNLQFACNGTLGTLQASGGMSWGSWRSWHQCPDNTAICGIDSKFEGSQGGDDDTALNGVRLYCCNLPCNNNGICESNEAPQTCSSDCGAPQYCGDGYCNNGETSWSCSSDCGPPPAYCGDGMCNGGETSASCPVDCGGGGPHCQEVCPTCVRVPECPLPELPY